MYLWYRSLEGEGNASGSSEGGRRMVVPVSRALSPPPAFSFTSTRPCIEIAGLHGS
jgi:hypothetical protein